jgi:CDP-ribitol ribitolphosphotransferase / teichoic acid ribitol-phosphate polymerase
VPTPVDAQLRSAAWERIQLVLRFAGDPGPVRLAQAAEPRDVVAPTRQWREGDETVVRINPFIGPGLRPLAAGTWTLSNADGAPLRVSAADGALPGAAAEKRLSLPVSAYVVRTAVDGAGRLTLDVEVDTRAAALVERDTGPVQRLWKRARRWLWRIAFSVLRTLARNRPVILFATRLNSRLTGNLESVHARMVERGMDKDYRLVVVAKPDIGKPMTWRDRLRLLWGMAAAKVIFLDDSFYPVYWVDFPPDVRIIQLWHAAGAFKTVGYSRSASAGKPPFNPFGRVHKNTTHAIVSSDFDAPFYAEALGLPEDRLVPTGIPRMDRFFDPVARDAALAKARRLLPQIAGHQVWLFAATYRGEKVATASYDFDQLDLDGLYALAAEQDAVVLFKHHPFITHRIDVPEAYRDRLVEATDVPIDVNDLLFSVDLLITDYSSIVFEYSVLNRPMVFFAYDLDEYIAERDFYVPFDEFVPGPIVRTFADLLEVIRRGDLQRDKVEAFAAKHFAHLDGQSTDRVIDLALGR